MKIEVGKEYIGTDGSVKLVKYVGDGHIIHIENEVEQFTYKRSAEIYWRPKPVEREKIVLQECITGYSTSFVDSNGYVYDLAHKKRLRVSSWTPIPNGRTIEIYADDYTMVEE